MKALRNLAGFLLAVVLGYFAVYFALSLSNGMCSAQDQLIQDPIGALLSRQPAGDPGCPGWPSMLETWLTLWLPLCAAFFISGMAAAYLGTRVSPARCAMAGALPYGSLLAGDLFIRRTAGDDSAQVDLSLGILVTLAAVAVGALLGIAGGVFWKRTGPSASDGILEHPERLDEMLDPTDDA